MVIEVIPPRDRAAWLRVRGRDVTASTVGALFGAHEFVTPFELWAIKSGRIPRTDDETDAMRRGRLLEPVAVAILREERPDWRISYNDAQVYYRDPALRLGGTPDVLVECPRRGPGIVQIKSVESGVYRRKWLDEEGHPDAPLWIALQATLEAYLTGARWAAVMPLVIGFGIEAPLVDVPLDHMDGVIAAMAERAADFWSMVEEGREPPLDYERDAAMIDRLYAIGDAREEIDLTADPDVPALVDTIRQARAEADRLLAAVDAAGAKIKARMGTAEVAHIAGGRTITWKTYRRPNPGGVPTTYRMLRLPKG